VLKLCEFAAPKALSTTVGTGIPVIGNVARVGVSFLSKVYCLNRGLEGGPFAAFSYLNPKGGIQDVQVAFSIIPVLTLLLPIFNKASLLVSPTGPLSQPPTLLLEHSSLLGNPLKARSFRLHEIARAGLTTIITTTYAPGILLQALKPGVYRIDFGRLVLFNSLHRTSIIGVDQIVAC